MQMSLEEAENFIWKENPAPVSAAGRTAIEKAAKIIEEIEGIRELDEDTFIIKKEMLKTAERMFNVISDLNDTITAYNKTILLTHINILKNNSDILSPEQKTRYVNTMMKHSVI